MSAPSRAGYWCSHQQLLMCGLSLVCVVSLMRPVQADEISGIMSQALDNSAQIDAFGAREDGAAAAVDEARAAFLPSLAAKFSYGSSNSRTRGGGPS